MAVALWLWLLLASGGADALRASFRRSADWSTRDDYAYDRDNYQEFIAVESERGLFPNIFNLATNSLITASATCGQQRREEYCKLVEHVLLRKTDGGNSPQCDICDANDASQRHPVEFAIDGTRRWWQSPSLANGLEYEKVNMTIDLRQEYQVAYVIVKMGNAPRPGTWVLEKSLDGIAYIPWQYYATSDAECMRQFGVPATTGVPHFQDDEETICTSEYSKLTPLEHGEIHTSLVNGRPGAEKPSVELQRFTRARFVRLRLISPRTLNADLMIINRRAGNNRLDKSVTMRYFYSISDISIGGQCICYGHAESCPSDPVTGQFKCECRHNTCGESCNRCCPLFNQLPYRQGTNSQPNICQPCQCFDHADECVYDEELERNHWSITPEGVYEGGGRCIDCKHNTEGYNCERCKDGFYRPSGITHYRADACRACECDLTGSVSETCIRDDQTAVNGQQPGDCVCKPGFGGRRCERCAPGYRNWPKCEPCPCNQAGSVNYDTCEEDNCICKPNVEGLYCDRCKAGTIHLNAANPQGCQKCFCFGVSEECGQEEWTRRQISAHSGWHLTDLTGSKTVNPDTESEILLFNVNQNKDKSLYYWKAPHEFTGNLLNSYGGNLHYYVYYVPKEQAGPVPVADLVIEGNGIKVEYYSRLEFFPRENMTVQIPIREGNGWYNSATRTPVDKADMMRALSDVELFMVRAIYNQQQLQSSIFGLSLDTAALEESNNVTEVASVDHLMRGVEVCECPANMTGNSCESCLPGFRRVNNQLYGGRCEPCNCQGHSDICDPFTGACLACQHNTEGARCERCLPGHVGNPSLGGEAGACKQCACPTLDNNRSPECALTQLVIAGAAAASNSDGYVCTACERGYEGNRCEMCADGFFGDPMSGNGTCEECACNGNIDPMAIGNCDTEGGRCLKCIHNTRGHDCEECLEHHWGSALQHTCRSCGCHRVGSLSQQCDEATGKCECHENYEGEQCDRCKPGHGDIDNHCPACDCDGTGAIGEECDEVSGQCTCKQGVFGRRCDQCLPSYYDFSEQGCKFCHCNTYGAIEDGKCDNVTGACECRENVVGTMCESCADGFFNITSGAGCQPCGCDAQAADGQSCQLHSGQCTCKPGVTGLKCDQCAPNHYGLGESGCKECRKCPAPGQVCDPVTGECVCPPNTVGKMCEKCAKHSWDHHPLKGCRACECDGVGSDSNQCDMHTGQCKCRDGFVGQKCDRCTIGFFGFPSCEACSCDAAGTDPMQCRDGLCLCDETGQCPCKKNVVGLKCDQCAEGSFSLDSHSAGGCTDCFCFNRTSSCEQSSLYWQQIYAEDRKAVFSEPWEYYTKRHNLNVLKDAPATFNSYPTDATPLYWSLPKLMLGDRTTSYNGFLRFKIWNEDNRRAIFGVRPDPQYFRYFPQVVLVGNNRIELEHIPMEIMEDGKYKIRLHESSFRSRVSPEIAVSRRQMMVALQNLQAVYIRGSYNYPARDDAIRLQEVSLDVAVADSAAGSPAIGVERCTDCPQGYSGLSCQDPAEGYCRKRQRDYLNSAAELAPVGWSEPCMCHGHSTTCEAESCMCKDCQHNTMGDFCELCQPGYIGDARNGGVSACTKCACPTVENSFSDSCKAVEYGRGYVCDACRPGYTGQYCESCMPGYFGDPTTAGGFCEACDCHADGSIDNTCDPVTGQCECRPGVTGRDCSRCQARHAFIRGQCTSCDQGCYLPLMQAVDALEVTLADQDFSNLRPVPWKRVGRIGNDSMLLLDFISTLVPESEGQSQNFNIERDSRHAKEAAAVVDEALFQLERANKSSHSLALFQAKVDELLKTVQSDYASAFNTTNFLRHFIQWGGASVGGATLDSWLMEAEAHREGTVERGEYIEKRNGRTQNQHEMAEELLKKVFANKLNDTSFELLNKRYDEFESWMEAYRATIYDEARKDTVEAERMSGIVGKRIGRYKDVVVDIEKAKAEGEDALNAAREAVELAKGEELINMFDDHTAIKDVLLDNAANGSAMCREDADRYAQLIDEYEEQFVLPATRHAEVLETEADRLGSIFSSAKTEAADPIAAAAAYKDIVDAMVNASNAATGAEGAAADAFSVVDPTSASSMLTEVRDSLESSEQLSEKAKTQKEDWDREGVDDVEPLRERLAFVNEQNIDTIRRNDVVKNQWSKFDDHHDRMAGVQAAAREAEERATEAKKTADRLKEEAETIGTRLSTVEDAAGAGIRDELEKVRAARMELEKTEKSLANADQTAAANIDRAAKVRATLDSLKERVNEAREKAQQIRLSLRSDERGECKRQFLSPAQPSPSNHISVRFRPLRNVPDSVVYVTATKQRRTVPSEYLALEIKDKRVVVHWNIGGGKKMATNAHPIHFVPQNDANTWYHFDVERNGNAVRLTVALKESRGGEAPSDRTDPVTVFVGSSDGEKDSVFNTVPGETMLATGVDQALAAEIGLSTNTMRGTLGELTVDGRPISLWAFSQSASDGCEGAVAPTQGQQRGHSFRDGFALVRLPVSERTVSAITVQFATYSRDGMLYFRGQPGRDDFVAVQLKDGFVEFKINLGGGSFAELRSKKTYTDGKEHTVKAIRNDAGIHLQVDSDADRFSTVIPGENTALNIDGDDHYVGGVPPEMPTQHYDKFALNWRGFHGCISSVKPSQVADLDLDHPVRSLRREPGCSVHGDRLAPAQSVVGFARPGYVLTRGVAIDNNATLAFSFRTKEENGTLVFQSSRLGAIPRKQRAAEDGGKGYMAFYLYRGFLVLHFGKDASTRTEVATIRSSAMYNDGRVHSVVMSRMGADIRLRVDDREVGEAAQLGDESPVGSTSSQLFIGGFPDRSTPPSDEIPSTVPLIGCIADLYLNYKRVPLIPEEHVAQIGSCAMDQPVYSIPEEVLEEDGAVVSHRKNSRLHIDDDLLPMNRDYYDLEPETPKVVPQIMQCAQFSPASRDGDGAVRYGISKSSHSRVNFAESAVPNVTSFSLSFSLRTEKAEGMLWVWANYKSYTRYFFLDVIDGYVTLEVKGHKQPKTVQVLERQVNDGHWHNVRLVKNDRDIELQVDELPAVRMLDSPAPKVMKRRMYIGGVISKHRQTFNLTRAGLDGCLRDLTVNGKAVSGLDGEETSRDVVPCGRPSKDCYAHDGGFAVFDGLGKFVKAGAVPKDVDISLEFRNIRRNGTIIAILSTQKPDSARISAQLVAGHVMVSVVHSASGKEVRDTLGGPHLCDGEWHRLRLHLDDHKLTVEVDELKHDMQIGLASAARQLYFNMPVHIGGVPAPVAEKLGMTSLVGCYRNLHLSGRPVYFEKALKTNKLIVDGCPL